MGALSTKLIIGTNVATLGMSVASPIFQSSQTIDLNKNNPPSLQKYSEKKINHSKERAHFSSDTPFLETHYTQKQIKCAEELGIDPSECTSHGTRIKKNLNNKHKTTHSTLSDWHECKYGQTPEALKKCREEEEKEERETEYGLIFGLALPAGLIGVCVLTAFVCAIINHARQSHRYNKALRDSLIESDTYRRIRKAKFPKRTKSNYASITTPTSEIRQPVISSLQKK